MRPWIIVTDGMQRKTLAAVRGLAAAGFPVAAGESTLLASALFSRHCRFRFRYPSPRNDEEGFIGRLSTVVRQRDARVLIPMEEETIEACLRHRTRFEPRTVIPMPDLPLFRRLGDKWETYLLAKSLDIPVPETRLLTEPEVMKSGSREVGKSPHPRPDMPSSGPPDFRTSGLPDFRTSGLQDSPTSRLSGRVVKPRYGRGARGILYDPLPSELPRLASLHGDLLLSERLEGEGVAAAVLLDREGNVRASFAHRQLREYPVTGGASTLRESRRCPEIEEHAARFYRAAGWWGVGHLEFRRDLRDGKFKLLDVNPRFWGSLALTVGAGVNMPALLVETALGAPPRPAPAYPDGRRARWLLPGDLLHLWRTPRRRALFPGFLRPDPEDTFAWSDPFPVAGLLASAVPYLLHRSRIRGRDVGGGFGPRPEE